MPFPLVYRLTHLRYSGAGVECRAEVLDLYRRMGLRKAAMECGVDKKTILSWFRAQGGTADDQCAITTAVSEEAPGRCGTSRKKFEGALSKPASAG